MRSSELRSLGPIWKEQSEKLSRTGVLAHFNERLSREWAIETGIIENLYSIDRGVTQLLIERGIEASLIPHGSTDKPPEHVVAILRDHHHVLEGLFDFVAQRRPLTTSYIKELHAEFTRHQETVSAVNGLGRLVEVPLIRGEWKHQSNNPTRPDGEEHEYCPPEHVQAEMDRLIAVHDEHSQAEIAPEIEAAWLHHRFTQIHPFQDGNGRLARTLASLIFLRAGWFPLVVDRDRRTDYIDALEQADGNDLRPLAELFAKIQIASFLRALNVSEDVLKQTVPMRQIIIAATERLKARFEAQVEKQNEVFNVANSLSEHCFERFRSTAQDLAAELVKVNPSYEAKAERSEIGQKHWFRRQIHVIANGFGYFADTRTYASWVRLKIREERQAELIVSFHSLGTEFIGLVAASAFMEYRDWSEEPESQIEGPYPLCKEVFQVAFNEDRDVARDRFDTWLGDAMLAGLDQWRRQI